MTLTASRTGLLSPMHFIVDSKNAFFYTSSGIKSEYKTIYLCETNVKTFLHHASNIQNKEQTNTKDNKQRKLMVPSKMKHCSNKSKMKFAYDGQEDNNSEITYPLRAFFLSTGIYIIAHTHGYLINGNFSYRSGHGSVAIPLCFFSPLEPLLATEHARSPMLFNPYNYNGL